MADIDLEDPCAVAASLRQALHNLRTGQAIASAKIKVDGVERELQFMKSSEAGLIAALRDAEAQCAASRNERPRRFAIGTGYRPR